MKARSAQSIQEENNYLNASGQYNPIHEAGNDMQTNTVYMGGGGGGGGGPYGAFWAAVLTGLNSAKDGSTWVAGETAPVASVAPDPPGDNDSPGPGPGNDPCQIYTPVLDDKGNPVTNGDTGQPAMALTLDQVTITATRPNTGNSSLPYGLPLEFSVSNEISINAPLPTVGNSSIIIGKQSSFGAGSSTGFLTVTNGKVTSVGSGYGGNRSSISLNFEMNESENWDGIHIAVQLWGWNVMAGYNLEHGITVGNTYTYPDGTYSGTSNSFNPIGPQTPIAIPSSPEVPGLFEMPPEFIPAFF